MFNSEREGVQKVQRIATPEVGEKSRASLDEMTDILTPNIVTKLKEGRFNELAHMDPMFALLPHVLDLPVRGLVPLERVPGLTARYTELVDKVNGAITGDSIQRDVFDACVELLMNAYLLNQIDPSVPVIVLPSSMDKITQIQMQALRQDEPVQYVLIEAWRMLVDPSRIIPLGFNTLEVVEAEVKKLLQLKTPDATSREQRSRDLIKVLFALKILGPDRMPEMTVELKEMLAPNPWDFGWHDPGPGVDEAVIRAMLYVIHSPKVWVDGTGLHVERPRVRVVPTEPRQKPEARKI